MPKIHISKFVKLILCCIYLFIFFNVNNRPKDRLTNQNAAFGNKCICSLRYAQRYWTYPGQSDLWHDLFGSSNVAPTLPTRAQTVRLTSWNMYGGLHSALLSGVTALTASSLLALWMNSCSNVLHCSWERQSLFCSAANELWQHVNQFSSFCRSRLEWHSSQ